MDAHDLRKYVPYCIEIYEDVYFIINRDYEYINMGVKSLSPYTLYDLCKIESNEGKRIYLFNDTTNPLLDYNIKKWKTKNKTFFKSLHDLKDAYDKATINKRCLNKNDMTDYIFSF